MNTNGGDIMTFAELRKARGLSQRRLAAAAKIYKSTIIAIESGTAKIENISLRKAKGLADALGVTMEELLMLE